MGNLDTREQAIATEITETTYAKYLRI